MTGTLSDTANFLSELTVGGLVDLGYIAVIPEPTSVALLASGFLLLRRRRA